MKQRKWKHGFRIAALLLTLLVFSGCSNSTVSNNTQAGESTVPSQINRETSAASPALQEESEVRDGTHEDTLATPSDFPASYDYGSGRYTDWDYSGMRRRLPEPEGGETVLYAVPDPAKIQAFYLWEEGNFPARTEVTRTNFDPVGFRPYLTAIPVRAGTQIKGAVVLLAGGAFRVRANYTDTLPTAAHLRELGYQTFIVDYRLRPYTQEKGALDVARAVRFIRKNAGIYGIDPDDIAVMGYSAGGIQAGEFFLHYDENVLPTALDPDYIPDELDEVSAHASACGMIYSFYGRLSVASMDAEALREGDLPPTFYCYGTEDPFYRQFEAQYGLMQDMGIVTKRIVLQGWPHGFGGDGGWVEDYARWLEQVFSLR
ncbi:MAG TPA: alpha/beta hydrolase [Firmicutes bacterium]|nr:alpha/beta hydrolase [Bacillota bacterium]